MSDRSDGERADEEVPPGGGGADSGSADAVRIAPGDRGEVQNQGSQNRAPGVGTPRDRRAEKTQDAPRMSQHPTTDAEKLDGIVAQTRADLPKADAARLRDVVRQRAEQAGVSVSDATLDALDL